MCFDYLEVKMRGGEGYEFPQDRAQHGVVQGYTNIGCLSAYMDYYYR